MLKVLTDGLGSGVDPRRGRLEQYFKLDRSRAGEVSEGLRSCRLHLEVHGT